MLLPQAREFNYPKALFMSDGEMKQEVDRQVDGASAVLQAYMGEEEPEQGSKFHCLATLQPSPV